MPNLSREEFASFARQVGTPCVIPISLRILSDQLTPVLAYRRLVAEDDRQAPSFLLESVEGGDRQGRYSIMGARPIAQVVARGHHVTLSHNGTTRQSVETDPLALPHRLTQDWPLHRPSSRGSRDLLPACVLGGWFGYASYDTVRYAEAAKLSFKVAPHDDRELPDLHFALYDGVVVFDHVEKVVSVVKLVRLAPGDDPLQAYDTAIAELHRRIAAIELHSKPLPSGVYESESVAPALPASNMTREEHATMLARAKEYIRAGDIFQVVLGQRFERTSTADPFDVYRALRAVNPSPYMVYLQAEGCILVASSPEILCRVRRTTEGLQVTNRPLAGTRRRGETPQHDAELERELLADQKERAEHIMLVDLGRNDVGRVAIPGTVQTPVLMEVERYSHVMHISSTVTGMLRPGLNCWDALRAALPVGTISGAPKVRAMQIIDELEPVRRGPYGGGVGYVGLDGQMDIALTLRTMVVPSALHRGNEWTYHLQASGGIVADSVADDEYMETVNKSAALARAITVAERAFAPGVGPTL